jgi:peptide-methionine (S)-S-oxide reductase
MRKPRHLRPARAYLAAGLVILVVSAGIKAMSSGEDARPAPGAGPSAPPPGGSGGNPEKATFGAGCFWCVEAVFERLKGVESVVSGYSGGRVKNPTYEQVCSGTTGHAEAVQVTFDPKRISYAELLEVFWGTHDPTTRDRQGNDVGPQYRSVIFYHSDEQRKLAEHYKRKLDESGAFRAPIVTEIVPFREFFPAEGYHQDYYNRNARQPYCQIVIRPKVEKLKKVFGDKLADQAQGSSGGEKH